MKRTLVVVFTLLAGCASHTARQAAPVASARGDVFYQSLDVANDRYSLGEQEDFRVGRVQPDTRVVPAYPAAWLARAPKEVWVCTEVHIDAQGAVFGTRALHPAPCSPADAAWDADFRAAVDGAVRQWRFEPSYRCTLPAGEEADHECGDAQQRVAVPISRAFRFVFRVTERGGVVEGGERTPP